MEPKPRPRSQSSPRAIAVNLLLEHDLRAVVDRFAEHGIHLIVLKGIPLALRLFGNVDARAMLDNDLLVRRVDARRAASVLADLGYRSWDARRIENQLDHDHEFRMARPLGPAGWLAAELHWNCFQPDLFPVPETLLWEHAENFEWDDRTINVFDRPLTLVHLAAHFAQSNFGVPQILRDVAQAWNLWYADADADDALALAHHTGLVHALDFALLSAQELGLLSGPPPPIGSTRARRLRHLLPASRLWSVRPSPDYSRWLLTLLLVDPWRIPGRVFHLAFPPVENLAVIEGRPPSFALYLRYLARPLRPIRRILGIGRN